MQHFFQFEPTFRQYIWGGRRLETILEKQLPSAGNFAESWEIVDHPTQQSIISNGVFQGQTLHQLIQSEGPQVLGERVFAQLIDSKTPENLRGRFPLLFKFLDCNRDLSVQVHPDDEMGAGLNPPDLGKTEAWYVLHAEPGALIYAGLQPGFSKVEFQRSIEQGRAEDALHRFEAKAGDCVMIPAGTVHALGAGLVVAEIQQASDTTFRLFDWNRVDHDGKPRQLHIDQGIMATDFATGPINPVRSLDNDPSFHLLVECDKFVLAKRKVESSQTVKMDGVFRFVALIDGTLKCESINDEATLSKGQTMLISADADQVQFRTDSNCELLESWIP